MVKLSQQLDNAIVTRTQRVRAKEESLKEQRELEQKRSIQQAEFEEEKKEVASQNQKISQINYILDKASKIDQGKPFAMFGATDEQIKMVNEFRAGVGEGSKIERRTRYLQQRFPSVPSGTISSGVQQGTATGFGTPATSHGLDPGEIRTVTTVDQETGVVKRTRTTTRKPEGVEIESTTFQPVRTIQGITQSDVDQAKAQEERRKRVFLDFESFDASNQPFVTRGTTIDQRSGSMPNQFLQNNVMGLTPIKVEDQGFVGLRPIVEQEPLKQKPIETMKAISKEFFKTKLFFQPFQRPELTKFGTLKHGGGFTTDPTNAIDLTKATDLAQEGLSQKIQSVFLEDILSSGVQKKVTSGLQDEFDIRFEKKFGDKIREGEVTFEEATEQYDQSEEVKIITKKFEDKIEKERAGKFTKGGFKIAGLGLGKVGVSLIPTTVEGVVFTTTVAGVGVKTLSAIPPTVSNLITGGFGVVGVGQALSPTASPESKASGVITAGISGGILGFQTIKYLRSPTVKTVKIDVPKATLKASEIVGKEIPKVTQKGLTKSVVFPQQKLSQTAIAGRRTIVSTKFRDLLGFKPVFQGVPTAQRGQTFVLQGFRGSTVISKPSGYQKAFNLLTKRGGYTPSQARNVLRYTQPQVIEQSLKSGVITFKGQTAKGEFEFLTKRPVITLDKTLGIKTRGGRTIKDVFDVERLLLKKGTGGSLVIEKKSQLSFILNKKGRLVDLKNFQYSESAIIGKSTELKKAFEVGKLDKTFVFKDVKARDLGSISFKQDVFPSSKIIKVEGVRSKIIKGDIIDLTKKATFVSKSGPNFVKTPLSKTFGIEKVTKPVTFKPEVVTRIVNKIESTKGASQVSQQVAKELLKTPVAPPVVSAKAQLKAMLDVGVKSQSASKSALAGLMATQLGSTTQLRGGLDLKVVLKEMNLIKDKEILDQEVGTKSVTTTSQKTLNQLINNNFLDTSLITPTIDLKTPNIPTIETPVPPSIPVGFFFPGAKSFGKGKKKSKKQVQELLFLPDFTSRALGLKAEIVTEKQAQRKLKKILTGLEIRRGVKVKF